MLGSKLFSALFKVGDDLKWTDTLWRYVSPPISERACGDQTPLWSAWSGWDELRMQQQLSRPFFKHPTDGKSLGSGAWCQVRGKQKWFPVVISILLYFLIFSLGKYLPKYSLSKWFLYYIEVPKSLQINWLISPRYWTNQVVTYFPSLMAAYNLYLYSDKVSSPNMAVQPFLVTHKHHEGSENLPVNSGNFYLQLCMSEPREWPQICHIPKSHWS